MVSLVAYWRTYNFLLSKSLSTRGFPVSMGWLKLRLLCCCLLLLLMEINTCMYTYVRGGAPFTLLSVLIASFDTGGEVVTLFKFLFNNVDHIRNRGKIMRILSSLSIPIFEL